MMLKHSINIGSDNGMYSLIAKAITWTNDDTSLKY